jgi:ketosteroid isomerase-like protein
MCTTDMVFMPPEGSPVAGDAIRPWLEAFPVIKAMWWEVSDLDETGDLAVVRGPVKETLEIEGEEVLIDGKYCDVLRRGTDGEWRISVVMWNSSVP